MLNPTKSVLFKASAGTDVQYVGGEIRIPGLDEAIRQSRIVNFSQANYKAEVAQVVTIGASSYAPTASTRYIVTINDPNRRDMGLGEQPFIYAYDTPDVITNLGATAALQREAIHLALVAKINAKSANHVAAASLLTGTGFTITDDASYYPAPSQGMTNVEGASTIKLKKDSNGGGFALTDIALTTAASYGLGVGAYLAALAPVVDYTTGNLISGGVSAPKAADNTYATSGQKYNLFNISYLSDVQLPLMASNYKGQTLRNAQVWVDNGAGSATTNLAGYIAFERAMHESVLKNLYSSDKSATIQFFDKNFVIQGPLGAVPVTTTSLKNKFLTVEGLMNHYNIGTQTIVAPTQGAAGLLIEQDAAATEGAHYSAEVVAICPQEFVVGKSEITLINKFSAGTVANIVYMAGLRKKEAFTLDFNDYTEMAAAGTGPAGTDLYTYGILGNAATVATDSGANAADATAVTIVIKVAISGAVSIYINDVKYPVYSVGTTPLVFAAATVLIPFFQYTNLNSAAAVPNVTELVAVGNANVYNY
jgi:hypothetical protein